MRSDAQGASKQDKGPFAQQEEGDGCRGLRCRSDRMESAVLQHNQGAAIATLWMPAVLLQRNGTRELFISEMNSALMSLTGIDEKSDVEGQEPGAAFSECAAEEIERRTHAAMDDGQPETGTITIATVDGNEHDWDIVILPLSPSGMESATAVGLLQPTGSSLSDNPFLASIEALAASEHMASVGTLASGLGHDISNALLPLRLRLDSLARLDLPSQATKDIKAMSDSIEYLRDLTNSLRHLVIDSDEQRQQASVTLTEWWQRSGPLLKTALPSGAKLRVDLSDDLPPATIPPHQLTQVVLDLFTNIKEHAADDCNVHISARHDRQRGMVRMSIRDDGPGIPPHLQRKVTQPFFTTKIRQRVTGQGLYLASGILKSLGGSIQIRSRVNRGTTVHLIIPVQQQAGDETVQVRRTAVISLSEPRLAAFAGALLSGSGFQVRFDERCEPPDCMIWIVDATDEALDEIRREHAAGRDGCTVIGIGEKSEAWNDIDAVVINPSEGLAALRSALHDATQELSE